MRINSNIPSLFAQRSLLQTTRAISRALERLSSGKRLNSATDGAADLSISVHLASQQRGTLQAIRNMNDAQSLLDIADGAIATQVDVVQRMRELAVQAANGILNSNDREFLSEEFQQLLQEYNRVTMQTQFGGTNLLDGSLDTLELQVGPNAADTLEMSLGSLRAEDIFQKKIGTGTFELSNSFGADAFDLIDFNNDGRLDLIGKLMTNPVSVNLGNGDGTFQATRTSSAPITFPLPVYGDFNGDGIQDLVSGDSISSGLKISYGKRDGTFGAATSIAEAPTDAFALGSGDFDGDGHTDILSLSPSDSRMQAYLGDGRGNFTQSAGVSIEYGAAGGLILRSAYFGGGRYPLFAMADFNNDNNLDFAWYKESTGSTQVFTGDGNGEFSPGQEVLGYVATAGDFNGDGNADLTTWDPDGTGVIQTYLGNGNGTFGAAVVGSIYLGISDMQALDLNGDAKADLVLQDDTNLNILMSNGDGTFRLSEQFTTSPNSYNSLGDVDGDGVPDLVNLDRPNSTASVYLANTLSVSGVSDLTISTSSQAQDVLRILDTALENLNNRRTSIGASQNRLEFSSNLALIMQENLALAQSNVADIDYAFEMAELVRNQILQQAQVSVLAQANLQYQMVLNLLQS